MLCPACARETFSDWEYCFPCGWRLSDPFPGPEAGPMGPVHGPPAPSGFGEVPKPPEPPPFTVTVRGRTYVVPRRQAVYFGLNCPACTSTGQEIVPITSDRWALVCITCGYRLDEGADE